MNPQELQTKVDQAKAHLQALNKEQKQLIAEQGHLESRLDQVKRRLHDLHHVTYRCGEAGLIPQAEDKLSSLLGRQYREGLPRAINTDGSVSEEFVVVKQTPKRTYFQRLDNGTEFYTPLDSGTPSYSYYANQLDTEASIKALKASKASQSSQV